MVPNPIGNKVAVEMQDQEKEAGGIVLPDKDKARQTKGKLVAIGSGCKLVKSLSIGGMVAVPLHGGHVIEVGKKTYKVFDENDLVAFLD